MCLVYEAGKLEVREDHVDDEFVSFTTFSNGIYALLVNFVEGILPGSS